MLFIVVSAIGVALLWRTSRDCMVAKSFWNLVIPRAHQQEFYKPGLRECFGENLDDQWSFHKGLKWTCFFGVAIWRLWFWRNQFILQHSFLGRNDMFHDVLGRAEEIQSLYNSTLMTSGRKCEKLVGWYTPIWPWYKLNTDGACKQLGVSSVGSLIGDHNGRWVKGFGMNIGSCSVVMAELWGLFQGLIIAWQLGIRWHQVEVDSLCAYQMVANSSFLNFEFSPLIWWELIKRDWTVRINHIYREANYAANHMANITISLASALHMFPSPPKSIKPLLFHDMYGVFDPCLAHS